MHKAKVIKDVRNKRATELMKRMMSSAMTDNVGHGGHGGHGHRHAPYAKKNVRNVQAY
jgi:hypothetical protein